MPVTYPGESAAYRAARNDLLTQEVALRHQVEQVAARRRALPEGGAIKQDYEFTALNGAKTPFQSLFSGGKPSLAVYSLMFAEDEAAPCSMCASLLDGLDGQVKHFGRQMKFVVVAAASPARLAALAKDRGWTDMTLLSAQGTSFQRDYHAQMPDGAQLPMLNIFRNTPSGVRHFWGSESFFADIDGQPRHLDQIWPLWNMLDLTPDGRSPDWHPALAY